MGGEAVPDLASKPVVTYAISGSSETIDITALCKSTNCPLTKTKAQD
ncbi:hypothetical protein RIB2604_01100070 [Aspergillus luchuensis]|uniref:Uncharacterized protein n=1 Tax=Aspergillus kawachii TaxID=1069201 RepID=A0A146F653_ASPKA|nr:hypothetical protein RIB2604_01100070 [Aspergillus luchuensis]